MIQRVGCEFGEQLPNGSVELACDPARNIKGPECLSKWMWDIRSIVPKRPR